MHEGLPGADLIDDGLADARAGRETVAALLVSIGAPRLARLGLSVPQPIASPEHRLYARLAHEFGAVSLEERRCIHSQARQMRAG